MGQKFKKLIKGCQGWKYCVSVMFMCIFGSWKRAKTQQSDFHLNSKAVFYFQLIFPIVWKLSKIVTILHLFRFWLILCPASYLRGMVEIFWPNVFLLNCMKWKANVVHMFHQSSLRGLLTWPLNVDQSGDEANRCIQNSLCISFLILPVLSRVPE